MKPLSVMQIISSAEWGGREQHVKDLSAGLQQQGHQVFIVTRDCAQQVKRYEQVAEVKTLPLRNLADFHSISQLAKWICERQIDCIHVHTGRDAWLALLATKWAGRGRVFNSRHTVSRVKTDFVHRWYYRNLAAVICVSEMVRREFLTACPIIDPAKAVVVYNGIDVQPLLAAGGEATPFTGAQCLLGYAGRISPEKGLEHLIEAVYLLKKQGRKNIKLVMAGNAKPEYKEILEAMIIQFDISEAVEFVGFQENVAAFMNKIDIFVLPCVWQEAFGLVLCEAMVCNKPVISTRTGAQTELIDSGVNGLLVEEPSGDAIATAIKNLLDDPTEARAMAARARESVLQRFTLQQMVGRMVGCYRTGMR